MFLAPGEAVSRLRAGLPVGLAARGELSQLPLHVVGIVVGKNIGVGVHDELPAVTMALPFRNELGINTGLPQTTDEALAEVALGVLGQAQLFAGTNECCLPTLDLEHQTVGVFGAGLFPQLFQQRAQVGIDRHVEMGVGLLPANVQAIVFPLDVTPRERRSFGLA